MAGIAFLRRLLMKQAMKKSKDASGIMSLNKNLVNDVDNTVKKWVDSAKSQGQDIDKMGEQEIKYLIELNKPKVHQGTTNERFDALAKHLEKRDTLFGPENADVFDLTGKKIPSGSQIMGGEEVKIDIVADTIATIKSKKPIDAMAEANSVIGRKGKYKNLTPEESKKILKDTNDHIFERDIKYDEFGEIIKPDPEDFAGGGAAGRTSTGLNYLLGEDDQNSRVPLGGGKLVFDAARRKFLQIMGAGAATGVAAKSGLFSLLKAGKPTAQVLTSVPIKSGVDGMPVWFKPFVNKIIKTGDEVESGLERVIVHSSELPGSKTKLFVTQELDTGNVMVDIGISKHGFKDGHLGQPVRLEYKAAENIMSGPKDEPFKIGTMDPHVKTKTRKEFTTTDPTHVENIKRGERFKETGKPTKTKEEFWVEEAEFSGGHPENIKFEESAFEKFGSHGSNFDEVEKFATGKIKKKTTKESIKAERAHWVPEGDDFASGGRVPLGGGKLVVKGGNWLIKSLLDTRKQLKTMNLSPGQLKQYLNQIDDQIKNIKAGGKIPDEVIQTIRSDPKFKSVWQNQKSLDPELREMEEVLLEYGQKHATGGRVPLSGGIAGMLGE